MEYRRVTLLAGHYGSGKTNIAVNLALRLRAAGERVSIADMDIVNPYFRSADSREELERAGVELLCSRYAGTNLDVPALPGEFYAITDPDRGFAVVDVGGDDRGALALGRYAPALRAEGNYEMLFVINCYRPLTRTAEEAALILREVEAAASLPFTAIVNNSNLGEETRAEDVLASRDYALAVSELTGLPLRFTSARRELCPALEGMPGEIFPLELQAKIR